MPSPGKGTKYSLGNGVGVDLGHGEELRLDVGEEQQAEDTDGAEGAEDDEQVLGALKSGRRESTMRSGRMVEM